MFSRRIVQQRAKVALGDALSRFWTHFLVFKVVRMSAIGLGLPTMFITRVRL